MSVSSSHADGTWLDPELFTSDPIQPTLQGSKCVACSTVMFPRQGSCPRCAGLDVEPHALAREGAIWAFTVQRFAPKPPYLCPSDMFRPYGVAYVDLGGEILVEGRVVLSDIDKLRVGLPVRLVAESLEDAAGTVWKAFAFEPCGGQ
jgi:uncharacterized protein